MDLENVLGELLVDLPADAGVPVVASAREGTWLWPDWICRTPSVLLGWGRPFGSVEEMNLHLRNWRRRVVSAPATLSSGWATSPIRMPGATTAWCSTWPNARASGSWSLGNHDRDVPALRRVGFHKDLPDRVVRD